MIHVIDPAEQLANRIEEGIRNSLRGPSGRPGSPAAPWARRLAEMVERARSRGSGVLAKVLTDALHQAAERTDSVYLAVTGAGWLGGGIPSVERTLSELIASARHEILLTAYSVTPGAERIWDEIECALATGIRATIVVDHLSGQCDEARLLLERLARLYPEALSLYDFRSGDERSRLHAKLLVVDRRRALIGSANLSRRGMVSAHEIATVIHGPAADRIAGRFDALIRSAQAVRVGRPGTP